MTKRADLTPAQLRLVDHLFMERSIGAAADAAGVSRSTCDRWRRLPAFRAEIDRRIAQELDDATRTAVIDFPRVGRQFTEVIDDPEAKDADKIRAAVALADLALRLVETRSILARLEAIEARLGEEPTV